MKSNLISLFAVASMAGACGSSSSTTMPGGEVTMVEGTDNSKYVMSSFVLPKNNMTTAYDLDGDGTPDNRLGSIIQAVGALGLMPQTGTDADVKAGTLVILLSETSSDATQQSAKDAGVVLSAGAKTTTPPNFDGNDTFTVDTTTASGSFLGNITGGTFASNSPTTTSNPVSLTIALSLVNGEPPLELPVIGAYLSFTRGSDGKVTGGQVNGAIKETDVNGVIIPAVANLLTAQLMAPGACVVGTGATGVLEMFDYNKTCTATPASIMSNALISNFLAADVQMYQNGVYKPNPAHTTKDSLSIGIGFTAVGAKF